MQGVIVVDNALDHKFESLHVVYDGVNGQLPNLDLINTAVSVASGQMGIKVVLQRMWKHDDSYLERLQVVLRGMVRQGLGHCSGPHSSFIPYHVDAITLQAVGEGQQDEMAMGRVVEGVFRSLNNLLEHFHQSFFFYLLMQTNRFVSIGTYLPSAMLVAVNFTIMAIALWIRSGRIPVPKLASTTPAEKQESSPKVEVIKDDGATAVLPQASVEIVERQLAVPVFMVVSFHFLGLVPLYLFNNFSFDVSQEPACSPTITESILETFLTDAHHIHHIDLVVADRPGPRFQRTILNDASAPASAAMLLPLTTRHVSGYISHPQLFSCSIRRAIVSATIFCGTTPSLG